MKVNLGTTNPKKWPDQYEKECTRYRVMLHLKYKEINRKMSSFTCISMSFNRLLGYLFVWSTFGITFVSFKSSRSNTSYTKYGIELINTSKSHYHLPNSFPPVVHGMVKLLASFKLGDSLCCKTIDISSLKAIVSSLVNPLLLIQSSLRNFAYLRTCLMVSKRCKTFQKVSKVSLSIYPFFDFINLR